MTTAYPLQWPNGRPRTPSYRRERSRFKVSSFAVARDNLLSEVNRLGGRHVVLSTNIPLRNDGLPYANYRKPDDIGVAVYFERNKKSFCFACDRWDRIEDNMHAIRLTIESLRGVARWGTGDMMEATFTGFAALSSPTAKRHWRETLGFTATALVDGEILRQRYRALAMQRHPDRDGGSEEAMVELNAAMQQAELELI